MLDSIGLGQFLFSFGIISGVVFSVLVFVCLKMFFKMSLLWASVLGVCSGILGFLASPYIFYIFLRVMGYSL